MALSNIFREPRREITETVVGLKEPDPTTYCNKHLAIEYWNDYHLKDQVLEVVNKAIQVAILEGV